MNKKVKTVTRLTSNDEGTTIIERGVFLPRDGENLGPLEPWMVEWIRSRDLDVIPRALWEMGMIGSEIESDTDEIVASAISAILDPEEE